MLNKEVRDKLWVARCNEQNNGKRRILYSGKDFKAACRARQLWEETQSKI